MAIAFAVPAVAQSPIFRGIEDQFPPEATGRLALGDFDGDGDVDALSFWSTVFLNDGAARFTPHSAPSLITADSSGSEPFTPVYAIADMNADGLPDVVTSGSPWLMAWLNLGNGVLATTPAPIPLAQGTGWPTYFSRVVAGGDVDGDGDVDLFVLLQPLAGLGSVGTPEQPQLLLNVGAGFVVATSQLPAVPMSGTQAFLRDLDLDGDRDIFVPGGAIHRYLLNNGAGTFPQYQGFYNSSPAAFTVLADVNGDGLPDVVSSPFSSNYSSNPSCTVQMNLGGMNFAPAAATPCAEPGELVAADLNGDGAEEIIRLTANGITVHSAGAGGLSAPLQTIPRPADSGQAVDLDGDGDKDLVITVGQRNAVLLNDGQGMLVQFTGNLWGPPAGQWSVAAWVHAEDAATVGDVDGNGSPDLVWYPRTTVVQPMAVALNDGNGSLSVAPGYCSGSSCPSFPGSASYCPPRHLFSLDVNADGRLDLFTAQSPAQSSCTGTPDELHVNTGGGWSLALTLPASQFTTTQVKQGDLNGDALPDLVVAREYGMVPSLVLFNLGPQGWAAPVQLPSHATKDVALVDLDGDGDLDLVEANWLPTLDGTAVFLNDGAGNFTPVTIAGISGSGARAVAAGDLDGDGDQDLVLDQQVWLNGPALGFVAGSVLPVAAPTVTHLDLFDADRDGDLDLLAGSYVPSVSGSVVLFLNDGAGNFTIAETIVNGNAGRVQMADLDRDGDVDLIVPGPRILMNVTRQIAKGSIVRAGRVASLDLYGPAGGSWSLFASTGTSVLQVPPIGTVLLDLAGLQPFGAGTLSPAGTATLPTLLPPAPALVGFTTYLQALIGPPARVTNLEIMTVLSL